MFTPRPRAALIGAACLAVGLIAGAAPAATAVEQPAHSSSSLSTLPAAPIDHLGRPAPYILDQMRNLANTPGLPESMRSALLSAVGFFAGTGKPGVPLPDNAPTFAQFGWPTVANNCIGGVNKATGTAIAIPGPADLPLPGVPAGHTAFIFTALGTEPLAAEQPEPMTVRWLNITTMRSGTVELHNTGINPEGPATVSGIANTGTGTVLAYASGAVTITTDHGPATCRFFPTTGSFTVR